MKKRWQRLRVPMRDLPAEGAALTADGRQYGIIAKVYYRPARRLKPAGITIVGVLDNDSFVMNEMPVPAIGRSGNLELRGGISHV